MVLKLITAATTGSLTHRNHFIKIVRSCQEINLTSLAKYPEEILGIAGKAHT